MKHATTADHPLPLATRIVTVLVFCGVSAMTCGIVHCAQLGGPPVGVPMHPCRQANLPGATRECAENYDCPPYENPSGPCEWIGPPAEVVGKKRDAGARDAGTDGAR